MLRKESVCDFLQVVCEIIIFYNVTWLIAKLGWLFHEWLSRIYLLRKKDKKLFSVFEQNHWLSEVIFLSSTEMRQSYATQCDKKERKPYSILRRRKKENGFNIYILIVVYLYLLSHVIFLYDHYKILF